jgi:hypothetical protein
MTAFFDSSVRARLRVCTLIGTAAAFGLVFLLATAASAQERMHQITWAHASPGTVSRFVVLISDTDGAATDARQVDVGKPQASQAGSLSVFTAMVSFAEDQYLAVAAVGHSGQISLPSDWAGSPPTRPGQPLLVSP